MPALEFSVASGEATELARKGALVLWHCVTRKTIVLPYDAFPEWLMAHAAASRTYFETMVSGAASRLYFDIDISGDDLPSPQLVLRTGVETIKERILEFYGIELTDSDFLVSDGSRDDKVSWHLLLPYHWPDSNSRLLFDAWFKTTDTQLLGHAKALDPSVYSGAERKFRGVGCCKPGKPPLKIHESTEWASWGDKPLLQTLVTHNPSRFPAVPDPLLVGQPNKRKRTVSVNACKPGKDCADTRLEQAIELLNNWEKARGMKLNSVLSNYNKEESGKITAYIKTNVCRTCPHGTEHTSNNFLLNLHPNGTVEYVCRFNDTCKDRPCNPIGTLTAMEPGDVEWSVPRERYQCYRTKDGVQVPCVRPIKFVDDSVIVECTPPGGGKTTRMIQFIEGMKPDETVLILTHRVALIDELLKIIPKRLGVTRYDPSSRLMTAGRLICTIHSAWKIARTSRFSVVFIDEIAEVVKTLLSPIDRAASIWDTLTCICRESLQIAFLSAHADSETYEFIKHICGQDRPQKWQMNDIASTRKLHLISCEEKSMLDRIVELASAGEHLAIPFSEKKAMRIMHQEVCDRLPDLKFVELYGGQSPMERDQILTAIKSGETVYSGVFYTSSVDCGHDFQIEYDRVLFHLDNRSIDAATVMQMIGRFRRIKQDEIEVWYSIRIQERLRGKYKHQLLDAPPPGVVVVKAKTINEATELAIKGCHKQVWFKTKKRSWILTKKLDDEMTLDRAREELLIGACLNQGLCDSDIDVNVPKNLILAFKDVSQENLRITPSFLGMVEIGAMVYRDNTNLAPNLIDNVKRLATLQHSEFKLDDTFKGNGDNDIKVVTQALSKVLWRMRTLTEGDYSDKVWARRLKERSSGFASESDQIDLLIAQFRCLVGYPVSPGPTPIQGEVDRDGYLGSRAWPFDQATQERISALMEALNTQPNMVFDVDNEHQGCARMIMGLVDERNHTKYRNSLMVCDAPRVVVNDVSDDLLIGKKAQGVGLSLMRAVLDTLGVSSVFDRTTRVLMDEKMCNDLSPILQDLVTIFPQKNAGGANTRQGMVKCIDKALQRWFGVSFIPSKEETEEAPKEGETPNEGETPKEDDTKALSRRKLAKRGYEYSLYGMSGFDCKPFDPEAMNRWRYLMGIQPDIVTKID
jgi:hypothetical protein